MVTENNKKQSLKALLSTYALIVENILSPNYMKVEIIFKAKNGNLGPFWCVL